jgi:outer membrane autotransporter protein
LLNDEKINCHISMFSFKMINNSIALCDYLSTCGTHTPEAVSMKQPLNSTQCFAPHFAKIIFSVLAGFIFLEMNPSALFASATDVKAKDGEASLTILGAVLVSSETLPGSFKQLAMSTNQTSVAGALDRCFNDPSLGALMLSLGALTADEYPQAYESLNPSGLASISEVQYRIAGLQASALSGRMSDLLANRNGFEDRIANIDSVRFAGTQSTDEEMATAMDEVSKTSSKLSERWGGFYCGDVGNLKVDGDGNGEGYKATLRGMTAAGADFRIHPNLAVGFLFGYQDADINTDDGSHVDLTGGQLGVYGLVESRGFYAQALVEGGGSSYDIQRVSYGTVETGARATGTTDGKLFSGQLGGGYQYTTGCWAMGPITSVQYTRLKMSAFQETGTLAPEFFPSQAEYSLSIRWGAQASGDFNLGRNLVLIPTLAGTWLDELHDKGGSVTSSIAGQVFTVDGSKIGQSDFRVEASLGIEWKKVANISARYQKDLGRDNFNTQSVGVELRYKL